MNLKPNTPFCSTKRHDAFFKRRSYARPTILTRPLIMS